MSEKLIKFSVEDARIEFGAVQDGAESLVKEARIFYVGKHKGRNYSEEDLDKIVAGFDAKERVPIQLDHSTSARDTVGIVESLERRGQELFGKLRLIGREVVEKVRLGLWKKVSVGLSIQKPAMKLYEISITPFPALAKAEMFKAEEAGEVSESDNDNIDGKEEEDMSKNNEEKMVSMVEFREIKAQMDQMRIEKEKLEKQLRFAEDEKHIEKFVQEGRTTPAMRESELRLYNSMDDEQKKIFSEYKEKMPKFVELGKVYNEASTRKPGEINEKESDERAKSIASFAKNHDLEDI